MSVRSQPPGRSGAGVTVDPALTGRPFVIDWFERNWLAVWFFVVTGTRLSLLDFTKMDRFFLDGGIYLLAARTWLAGGDPFDLATLGVTSAKYVRIRDLGTVECASDPAKKATTGGFDLDAVAIVNAKTP